MDAGLLCDIGAVLRDTVKVRPRIERIYLSIAGSRDLHVFPQSVNLYISSHLCKQERDCDIIPESLLLVCVTNAIKGLANLFASPIWSYHLPPCCRASWYGRVKVERHRPPSVSLRTVGLWTKVKWVPTTAGRSLAYSSSAPYRVCSRPKSEPACYSSSIII
jgi:hypothetical protein